MKEATAQALKHGGDAIAASITVATIFKWLPGIAALFTIIWTGIRIWESETVRGWTGRKTK